MSVIALWSESDHLLSVLAPIGLALNRSPSLVVDLDPFGPRYQTEYSLADLVADGPTRAQLEPPASGITVLPNGGVAVAQASDVVGALANRWPNVVIRCDPRAEPPDSAVAIVPLLPAPFLSPRHGRVVFQSLGFRVPTPAGSLVLPSPDTATVRALTGLARPPVRSKWVRALGKLWALS